jgi:drug/metabolite transporter (DMT)-like permease
MSVVAKKAGTQTSTVKIIVAFAAVYIIWGTTYLGIRIAIETIPPFLMAGLRFVLAGGVMLAVLLARGAKLPRRVHWHSVLIIGVLMVVGGNGLVTFAEQRVASGLAALIVATEPVWIALLEWLIYKGQRPTVQVAIGLVVGLTGMALLVDPGQNAGVAGHDLLGIGIVLAATLLWSIGGLYSRRAPLPADTLVGIGGEMLVGGVLLILLGVATGESAHLDWRAISLSSALAFLYLTVFGSIVAYTAFIWLMKTVDPAKVATSAYVNPVVAVFLGWLVAGEVVTLQMSAAAGVILVGVVFINSKPAAFRRILRFRLGLPAGGTAGDRSN